MGKLPLSVVVLTKNEEKNIAECLESVFGWVDEIIIVDDESTDKTVAIAQKWADKILHRRMDNEGRHRNWAYAQARSEWVLSLDADEMVSPALKEELFTVLAMTKFHAFSIPLRNYIGNYWVRYGGWYPAGKLRLFQKSRFKYEEVEVHPRVFLDGETGHLQKDIIHKGYPDFAHFLASQNRQTTLEAQKWIRTGRHMSFGQACWRTIDRFFRHFLGKQGFRDGLIGLKVAMLASRYQAVSYMKYLKMKRGQSVL